MWMEGGLVGALFGFTGLLDATAIVAQALCVVCGFFCFLSLLFSLFEAPELTTAQTDTATAPSHRPGKPEFSLVPNVKPAMHPGR